MYSKTIKLYSRLVGRYFKSIFASVFALSILASCTSVQKLDGDNGPTGPVDWSKVKPVKPKKEPRSRYGNPETYEVYGITYRIRETAENFKQHGVASWYGSKFHGRRTSSGETYDMLKLTAAHKTLPIPCYVRVTNNDNGRELVVRVNDRGPFVKSRIIDLSYAAAHQLGMADEGIANVTIETISIASSPRTASKKKYKKAKKQAPKRVAYSQKRSNEKRFVQVGAYSNHANAQKLAKILDKEIALPVVISQIKSNAKKLYRVRIGPILSEKTAQELADILNIKELGKPRIVYQ